MKFILANGEEAKKEAKVELRLVKDGTSIMLEGKEAGDLWWEIMRFKNGKFTRCPSCEIEGLELDDECRIVEEEE